MRVKLDELRNEPGKTSIALGASYIAWSYFQSTHRAAWTKPSAPNGKSKWLGFSIRYAFNVDLG